MQESRLADIWGDTVDLKHLAAGMSIGIILGLVFYLGGINVIKTQFPKLPANLVTGYALLSGIVGCLLAAFVSAKLFPPKREVKEAELSEEERLLVIRELNLDMEQEALAMQGLSPEIEEEMKQLKLYDLFGGRK